MDAPKRDQALTTTADPFSVPIPFLPRAFSLASSGAQVLPPLLQASLLSRSDLALQTESLTTLLSCSLRSSRCIILLFPPSQTLSFSLTLCFTFSLFPLALQVLLQKSPWPCWLVLWQIHSFWPGCTSVYHSAMLSRVPAFSQGVSKLSPLPSF